MKNLINLILGLLVTIFISGNTFGQNEECIVVTGTPSNLNSDYIHVSFTLDNIKNIFTENGNIISGNDYDCLGNNPFGEGSILVYDVIVIDTESKIEDFNNEIIYITDSNYDILVIILNHDGNYYYIALPNLSGLSVISNASIEFSVYPNPTSDFINIKTDEWSVETSVIDINGNIVINSTDKQIDIRDLPQGVYFVSVNNSKPKRIIKN